MEKLFICHVRINIYDFLFCDEYIWTVLHIDAGIVGDYSKAQIFVHKSSLNHYTGIIDDAFGYITDEKLLALNATSGIHIMAVLAWPTRLAFVEVISTDDNSLPGSKPR